MTALSALLLMSSIAIASDGRGYADHGRDSAHGGPLQPARGELAVESSTPQPGDADVRLDTTVTVVFSNRLADGALDEHVRVAYSARQSRERGEPHPPPIAFTLRYSAATRTLEIRPEQPLERFREVRVDLRDIVAEDGAVLAHWTLVFATGGSAVSTEEPAGPRAGVIVRARP